MVNETEVTGTLHYVTDYIGFNGTEPAEQEGNYLALKVDPKPIDGATIIVELVGGKKGPVTLDGDRMIVIRIENKDTQTIKVAARNSKNEIAKTYSLAKLTLEQKSV